MDFLKPCYFTCQWAKSVTFWDVHSMNLPNYPWLICHIRRFNVYHFTHFMVMITSNISTLQKILFHPWLMKHLQTLIHWCVWIYSTMHMEVFNGISPFATVSVMRGEICCFLVRPQRCQTGYNMTTLNCDPLIAGIYEILIPVLTIVIVIKYSERVQTVCCT